jgi:arylsulfatase A-like enzyme
MPARILAVFAALASAGLAHAADRPNIILCMADDQGWGDVGYYGKSPVQTPVMDEMAAAGLQFDRFYAAAPVCSPTRGSVLTGRHPNRFGCFSWGHTLRPQEVTLAEALHEAGYATGHFGKWHLGSMWADSPVCPGNSGFDEWFSSPNFYENSPLLSHNGEVVETSGESSMVTVEAALPFMRQAVRSDQPFLAVIWFGNPHSPHQAVDELRELYPDQEPRIANFLGEVTGIDRAMGRLRDEIRGMDIAENTLLWYTSDNGAIPQGSTGGLRGKKGNLYEGGLRVPAIIEWPGTINEHRVIDEPCGTVDIYPTVLEMAGVAVAEQPVLDGVSLAGVIEGHDLERNKPLGFWVYPEGGISTPAAKWMAEMQTMQREGRAPSDRQLNADAGEIEETVPADVLRGRSAWIDGDLKLHRSPRNGRNATFELYNLDADPTESEDLAATHPDRVQAMAESLESWQRSVIDSLNGADY